MEEEESKRQPWSFATNWVVSDGAVESCIRVETPISSDDDEHKDEAEDRISPIPEVVLLSQPPSSDSGPCEIQIKLAQRHEIRQVYVRSSARIYEIYLATETSSRDYLCTVRCGIAAREDSILNDARDTEEATRAHLDGPTETMEPSKEKIKNDNNGINEDGWVEVKAPGSSSPSGSRDNSLERQVCKKDQTIQEVYEATAEISDSDPCISLTLRLLSLQTKGSICLEEIYIFAEPVDSNDSDHPRSSEEKLGGSNLMAMLVPTLLQISKSGVSKIQDRGISDIRNREDQWHHDGDVKETNSFSSNIGGTQKEPQCSMPLGEEKNVEEATQETAESSKLETGRPVPGTRQGLEFVSKENDFTCSRTERLLEQLLGRVGRIEAFCLGIEGDMMKSLSSIDTRLQRLEQQMELLTTGSQPSELYPSIRITSPEFSCNDSETNSHCNDDQNCVKSEFSRRDKCDTAESFLTNASKSNSLLNDGNDDHCCRESEYCGKDATSVESSSFNHDTSISLVTPQLSTCLVVTAPEFSIDDSYYDDQSTGGADDGPAVKITKENIGNDALEKANEGCTIDKPSLSLDDALACALAGFLSLSSVQPPKSGQNSSIEVIECSPNEDSSNSQSLAAAHSGTCLGENVTKNVRDTESIPCSSIQVNNVQVMKSPNDSTIGTAAINVVRRGPVWDEELEGKFLLDDRSLNPCDRQYIHGKELKDCDNSGMEIKACKDDALNQSDEKDEEENNNLCKISDQTQSGSGTIYGMIGDESWDATSDTDSTNSSEVLVAGKGKDEIENLLEPAFNGAVDFEFPILDVKFIQKNGDAAGFPLIDLLENISELKKGDTCSEENEGVNIPPEELKVPVLSEQLLVEVDDVSVKTVVDSKEEEGKQTVEGGLHGCSNQALFISSSLI